MATLKGTKDLDSVKNEDQLYSVSVTNLSLYCARCCNEIDGECVNHEWVNPWSAKVLCLVKSAATSKGTEERL